MVVMPPVFPLQPQMWVCSRYRTRNEEPDNPGSRPGTDRQSEGQWLDG